MDRAERVPYGRRPLNLLRIMPAKGGDKMVDSPDAARFSKSAYRTSVFEGARPALSGDLVVESHGMAPIPEDQRYGTSWRNFTVWFAPNMELSGVFTGTLAFTLGWDLAWLVAIVIGVCLGALPVALLATFGPKTGMGQLPLARLPFGKSIALPAAVQWLSAIAWDGLVGLFGAEGAQPLFHIPFAVGVLIVLALEGLSGSWVMRSSISWRSGEAPSWPSSSWSCRCVSSNAATFPCITRSTAERRWAPSS